MQLQNATTHARKVRRMHGTWGVSTVKVKSDFGKKSETPITNAGGFFMANELISDDAEHVASVGTSRGITLNLGNYESARIDVWMSLPVDVENVEKGYAVAAEFVEKKLEEERDRVAAALGLDNE